MPVKPSYAFTALVLAGCHSSEPLSKVRVVSSVGLPSGWTRLADDRNDTIAYPPTWKQGVVSKSAFEANVQKLKNSGKTDANSAAGAEKLAEQNQIPMLLFGPKVGKTHPIAMLFVRPNPNKKPLPEIGTSMLNEKLRLDSKATLADQSLPAAQAALLRYTTPSLASGVMMTHSTYVFLEGPDSYYVLDFAIPVGDSADEALVPKMADSFMTKG